MPSNVSQQLHTRPLQSFKIVEDLTTALHREILRIYGNCMIMWGDTICEDEAIALSMTEIDDAVTEYETNVSYHACGQRRIKIWAGTSDRVKQAALWSKVKDKAPHPRHPRAQYGSVMTQFHEKVLWCDKCSVAELRTGDVLFNAVASPGSLAGELSALNLNEDDRKRVESRRRGERVGKLKPLCPHLQPPLHSAKENYRSSTRTTVGSNELTQGLESVGRYYIDGGVLLRNEHGCYQNLDGICCCPCPRVVHL